VTLWESVWEQVRNEVPQGDRRPKTWGGFFGAAFAALAVVVVWFPVRLVHEFLKASDLSAKPDHSREAAELFREAYALSCDLPTPSEFAESVLRHVELPPALHDAFFGALRALYAESILLSVPPVPVDLESLEGIRWRDRMRTEIARIKGDTLVRMRRACLAAGEAAAAALPKIAGDGEITSPLGSLVHPGRFVEQLVAPLEASLFPTFADRYEENRYKLSGVPRVKHPKTPKLVEPHHLDDPSPFLEGTPFATILDTPLGTEIPLHVRSAHHWIVAGSGAGKTNALQYFIAKDLERAVRGECSIVVLDSQHQLIDKLWSLRLFAPGQALDGKLCLLDAADVEFPIAVNLFDMKLDRVAALSLLEREKLTNSALEMYDFIIGSLLQSEMTSRQSTLFRFVTRALFGIPDATIHTFHDILQNGPGKYQGAIDTLDETTRQFFTTDFNNPQFKQTKEQVIARLWAVLGNRTFLRMFSGPCSKVDLFAEINTPGKVVLINAEKGLLKEEGTELFGRFFLALINQAAAQRSAMPVAERLPCYVYVDECHNYIRNDPKIQVILAEARQQNVGVVLAHQYLAQLETPVLRALNANTSIKMAARLEGTDRGAMARDMNTFPDFIRDQKTGSFAVFVRGETPSAISMHFPLNALARFEAMTSEERALVRQRNRARYAGPADPEAPKGNAAGPSASAQSRRPRRDPDAS
jgi:hypothetical protein